MLDGHETLARAVPEAVGQRRRDGERAVLGQGRGHGLGVDAARKREALGHVARRERPAREGGRR